MPRKHLLLLTEIFLQRTAGAAPTEGGAMVTLFDLIVEETGVFVTDGDDDVANGQIGLF